MRIISKSALMVFTKIIKISPCLSKLQLAKVGVFFETQCRIISLNLYNEYLNMMTCKKY